MDLRKMMVVCAVALSGLAVGCKSDCEKVCSDAKGCGLSSSTDCSSTCDDADKQAEKEGCKSQEDDLMSCVADQDICNESSLAKCATQAAAFDACDEKYCTAHPDDSSCGGSTGLP
jgi:hypothetical protein